MDDVAGHFMYMASRPFNHDDGGLDHAILNLVLWLSVLVKLNSLGILA